MMKIIMIDAFKPEYLENAPYLSSLTKKFQWGEVEMPLGFEGGMEIFFRGNSSSLALFYREENSDLNYIKYFSFLEKFGKMGRLIIDCLINFPRLINGKELFKTGNIPLKQLSKCNFSVNKPLYKIKNVEYTYIGDLDRIGHKYGTKSQEIIAAIKKVDEEISKMNFDIILSDHGMIDIDRMISVPETKDCMIDSTLARYWGEKPNFYSKDGKWIEWADKRYGDYIFLANPGVLIFPNYWQKEKPVKAMHGYSPECKDMNAIYIINQEGKKKNLKIKELNNIFRDIYSEQIENLSQIKIRRNFHNGK
jgi:hypothetical protein